jgi:O-antigen/teichoic acid export membrane protein
LSARAAAVYAVGIVANLLLARLLVPRDFGVVALGTGVVTLGTYFGEAGVAAALIRRREEPMRPELEAANGLQLGICAAIAVAALAIGSAFGSDGLVIALMSASLPIAVLRSPSVVVLERRLSYGAIARSDVASAMAYYGFALATVALGAGVWGLAAAVVVRAATGTAVLVAGSPVGLVRPRWSWPLVRPLLEFGTRFQTSQLLQVAREQGLTVGVAAVGGLATLGVWNLAWRVLQVPNLVFLAVGRVTFPVMSLLLGAGEDPRPTIERSMATLAVITGAVCVALVGFAPALPTLVGEEWDEVPAVLLWSGLALIVGAPMAVASVGYLYALDEPGAVIRATLASGLVWIAVALLLLDPVGTPAVGIGWLGASIVNVAVLWRPAAARSGASIAAILAAPTGLATAAAAVGWFVAREVEAGVLGGIAGAAAAELLLLAGLMALSRPALHDTWALAARVLRPPRPPNAE